MQKKAIREKYLKLFHMFTQMAGRFDFLEISRVEFMMLKLIGNKEEQEETVTVRDIAETMKVSSPAVSRMVRMCVDRNLLKKQILSSDRRNTCLILTKEGKETLHRCEESLCRVGDEVLSILGDEMAHQFAKECELFLNAFENAMQRERKRKSSDEMDEFNKKT